MLRFRLMVKNEVRVYGLKHPEGGGEVIMPWDEQAEDNPTFAFALLAAGCRNHAFRSKA